MSGYEAVTFDLWNTLIVEGDGGLIRPRSRHWQRVLHTAGIELDLARLDESHGVALGAYQAAWRRNEQFRSVEATAAAAEHLGLSLSSGVLEQLAESFHVAGLDCRVELVPGAIETLRRLRRRQIRTAIICDIGLTPSSALRELLRTHGLLDQIDVQAWSDEREVYKPSREIFDWALAALCTPASKTLHVGDRLRTDVAGARTAGWTSVRFRGIYDDDEGLPDADFVIDDLRSVVEIIERSHDARDVE